MPVLATLVCLTVSQSIIYINKSNLYLVLVRPNLPLDTTLITQIKTILVVLSQQITKQEITKYLSLDENILLAGNIGIYSMGILLENVMD